MWKKNQKKTYQSIVLLNNIYIFVLSKQTNDDITLQSNTSR